MNKDNMSKSKDGIFFDLFTYKKEKLRALLSLILLISISSKLHALKNNNNNSVAIASDTDDMIASDLSAITENVTELKHSSFDNISDTTAVVYNYALNQIQEEAEARQKEELYMESIYNLMLKEKLTSEKLLILLEYMVDGNSPYSFGCSDLKEALDFLLNNDERSAELKMLIIMARDGYTYNELDSVCAGCVAEGAGAGTIDIDARAVASTIVNRTRDKGYVTKYGTSIYAQFRAPNQFSVYSTGDENVSYKKYLGRIDLVGYQAAVDVFYTRESIHDWKEFRAHWVDLGDEPHKQFVSNGNQYKVPMNDARRVDDPEFVLDKEDVLELSLTKSD